MKGMYFLFVFLRARLSTNYLKTKQKKNNCLEPESDDGEEGN